MSTSIKLLLTFVAAFAVLGLFQTIGSHGRIDLTESKLYTLSEGTQGLVDGLERPVELKLYFSQEGTQEIVRLRNYAKRVNELLSEISALNPDQVKFEQINPEPFSEAEDQAAAYGLNAVPVSPGQSVYFGLVAVPKLEVADADTSLVEDQSAEIIAFLQPDREAFLEYDIAQLIHKVGNPKKPVLGLLSGLEVSGGFDMLTRQPKQPWLAVQQMESFYDVQPIDDSATVLPDNLDVLVLIQPKVPNDALLYAIDQFALSGGRVLAFIDPIANSDQSNPMSGGEKINGADWNRLFHSWGVELNPGQVVGDMNLALMVNQGQGQAPVRHIAIQNYPEANIARTPFTSQIGQINVATAGEFVAWSPESEDSFKEEVEQTEDEIKAKALENDELSQAETGEAAEKSVMLTAQEKEQYKALKTQIQPLISTTENSGLLAADVFSSGADIQEINNQFQSDGVMRHIAVILSGTAVSAFPNGAPETVEPEPSAAADKKSDAPAHLKSGDINAILFADTDLLTDYLWVQLVGQFRGQSIAQPFADNGDLFLNALEHLSGNKALMSIRSRGTYSRPFSKVDELRLVAEQRFKEQELQLNQQLQETEKKLAELQPTDVDTIELNAEQQTALLDFQKERLRIRKSLRNVNLELNQDIRALGLKVKALNIFLVPVLLFIFAVLFFTMRQRQMERAKVSYFQNS